MEDRHARVARTLGYCLTSGTPEAWAGFAFVAAARLDPVERAALAFAALAACPPDTADRVALASIGETEGLPLATGAGCMFDARLWARHAHRRELKSYAFAGFEAMGAADRAAFLDHVQAQPQAVAA